MDDEEIRDLVAGAAAADTVAAYPMPDDRVLIAARDAAGEVVASFTIDRDKARRWVDGTLGAALILTEVLADSSDA
ncbi:hypothetical protein BBK14_01875 [Parafrankia soli]|uniref:Uncharacterized protein n=1 Tax=Parafrankia soli TaxID=2599596 RepID=A0A1S1RK55_9ACTN|nr:hypothetical protein [Parafrankia soli]OHV46620.1 hypothetical protein BBK14_01875 [Parafrankia soli]